jgi:hypothetical protein
MNRIITDRESDKATVARIEKEMAAPRMAKSVRGAAAKRTATKALQQDHRKKSPRFQRPN